MTKTKRVLWVLVGIVVIAVVLDKVFDINILNIFAAGIIER